MKTLVGLYLVLQTMVILCTLISVALDDYDERFWKDWMSMR